MNPLLPRRRLGRTGFEVTVYGVGGWLGLPDDSGPTTTAEGDAAAIAAVRRAVDLGVNYFDTSPAYGGGEAERHLGLGLRELGREERARLFIATKTGTHPARRHDYSADATVWSVEQSLRVLFADHLDVLLIHDPRDDGDWRVAVGPGGALEALERLKEQGVIRAIGLGVQRHRFLYGAVESGRFDVILTPYDYTLLRTTAAPLIRDAAAQDLGVINGSPYAAGLLAGLDPHVQATRRTPLAPEDLARARALWTWCRDNGVDIGVAAMQFSLRNPKIAVTLVGPRSAQEVEENVRHALTPVPDDLWAELDRVLPTLPPAAPGGGASP
jgi:aryl-alcohol dehydrogenase-like predicted oxidoreductase